MTTLFTLFIAYLEKARREQQFWCVNGAKIPNTDGENKYLGFGSDHLARAKNGGRKKSQATKSIQVSSRMGGCRNLIFSLFLPYVVNNFVPDSRFSDSDFFKADFLTFCEKS